MTTTRSILLAGAAMTALCASPAFAQSADTSADAREARSEGALVGTPHGAMTPHSGGAYVGDVAGAMQPRIIVRDDVGGATNPGEALDNSFDVNDEWGSLVQIFLQNNATGGVFLNCSGSLINPRTVLTAAHCLNSNSSEAYGLPGQAPLTMLIGFGPDTQNSIFNYIFTGASFSQGGVASSTDVIIHPSANLDDGGLPFPWADVAMIALDEPIAGVPTLGMLFSPLDQLTHVIVGGYGTNGTGDTGGINIGSPFQRTIGENELGLIGSPADFIDGVFPGFAPSRDSLGFETQTFYWLDFDDPTRTPADEAGCSFTGFNISCNSLDAVKAIDWFEGDALPREAGTAPGDSGSPLIADQLADFPLILGVLSGGFDFFGTGNQYGDVSFYNPLFPFYEFISANSPYKYVSAQAGDGLWTDASHWTQDLDPNFYVIDASGQIVNGLPTGPEEGVYSSDDKVGSVLGDDISGNDPADSFLLPPRTGGDAPGFGNNIPVSSVLTGPGSTGFVPDNTDGVVGTAWENPAQYFDVSFTRAGTTTLTGGGSLLDITVDQVSLLHGGAQLDIIEGGGLFSLLGVNVMVGTLNVGELGFLGTPLLINDMGIVTGSGVIAADLFLNRGGIVDPDFTGEAGTLGELTLFGDYIQLGQGVLRVDIFDDAGTETSNDLFNVLGAALIDGTLMTVVPDAAAVPRGSQYTVMQASNGLTGTFANEMTQFTAALSFDVGYTANSVTLTAVAEDYADVLAGSNANTLAVAGSLDAVTSPDALPSGELGAVVSSLDALRTASALDTALGSMSPTATLVFDQLGLSASRSFNAALSQRPRLARQVSGGFDASPVAARRASDPVRMASAGQDMPMPSSQASGRMLPSNMNAFLTADISFAEDQRTALSGSVDTTAVTGGIEARLSPHVSSGVAVTGSWVEAGEGDVSFDGDALGAGAYLGFAGEYAYASAHIGYIAHSFESERPVFTGAGFGTAGGDTDATQIMAGLEIAATAGLPDGGEFGPLARVRTSRLDIDAYTEAGAGGFGANIGGRTVNETVASLGFAAWKRVGQSLIVSGELTGEKIFDGDGAQSVVASLIASPNSPFAVTGAAADDSYFALRLGAAYTLTPGVTVTGDYALDIDRADFDYERFMVSLNFGF